MKIRILAVTAVFLAVFDVLIWHSVLADDAQVLAVRDSVGGFARQMPSIAVDAAIEQAVLAADGLVDVPAHPLDADRNERDARTTGMGSATVVVPSVPESTSPVRNNNLRDATISAAPENAGAPVRIRIPSIAVNAAVKRVALAADGSMDVPKRPLDTGWYALGPRPGEMGSATIAGHGDSLNGTAAVFADLHKARLGDKIEVQDDAGATTSFVVREIRRFAAAANATDVFTSNDGKAHLNLITCVGAWDDDSKQYSERLVVFADKEGE